MEDRAVGSARYDLTGVPMSQAIDIVVAVDAASVLGAIAVVPQIAKAVRDPASVLGVSQHSLVLQMTALAIYAYTNWRLDLTIGFVQNAGGLAGVALIWGLRLREQGRVRRLRIEQQDPTTMAQERPCDGAMPDMARAEAA